LHDRHKNYLEEVALIQHYLPEGGRLLDVGCNAGWLLGYLQKGQVKYELEGVEPSETLAEIARQRLNIPIHTCYLQDLDPTPIYDAMIATDVIEHINPEDINSFVSAIRERLKSDSYVFIKTPNVRFTAIKAWLMGVLPAPTEKIMLRSREMWDAKEHMIQWSQETLGRCFEQHGLKPLRFFVPLPVQTRNSPVGALVTRQMIYQTANLLGGRQRIPTFAQDIFMVAQKL
jgi:SAM-dependent methyltransferase